MARVTGIGGVFLRSKDPKAMVKWYAEHLGIKLNEYFDGTAFDWIDEVPAGTGTTAWAIFSPDSTNLGEPTQLAMVNYRVDDLDALVVELAGKGIWIDPKRDDSGFGKFAWIKDCDGNRVELWEPVAA